MKKVGTKIVTGLMFVGALAMTVFAGAAVTGDDHIGATENIETVEYTMEENDYEYTPKSMRASGKTGWETEFDTFKELIYSLSDGQGYALIWLKGYDKQVLVTTDKMKCVNGKKIATRANFYTKTHGSHVKLVGQLDTMDSGCALKIKDGVIYAPYFKKNMDDWWYETYLVTRDGNSLMSKDYIECHLPDFRESYYGVIRETNNDNCVEEISGRYTGVFRGRIYEYDNAQYIEFHTKDEYTK